MRIVDELSVVHHPAGGWAVYFSDWARRNGVPPIVVSFSRGEALDFAEAEIDRWLARIVTLGFA